MATHTFFQLMWELEATNTGTHFYTPVESIMEWPHPAVCPSTIACERDILKTACGIDFTFLYDLDTTKTSDATNFGHSMKTKMAATAV